MPARASGALLVRLGARTFALKAEIARGVVEIAGLRPIPRAGPLLLGLLPVRGSIVTLVDLAAFLATPHAARPERAVLVEAGGEVFAFPVDEVVGFATLLPPEPGAATGQLVTSRALADGRAVEALDLEGALPLLSRRRDAAEPVFLGGTT